MTVAAIVVAVLGAVTVIALVNLITTKFQIVPAGVWLTAIGIGVGSLPAAQRVHLDPNVILVVILPPLAYAAALRTGVRDLRRDAWHIGVLSVALPLATTFAVAGVTTALLPGLTAGPAVLLGAVLAPSDTSAAIGDAQGSLPRRLTSLLSAESLLNDATAITVLAVATETANGGHPSTFGAFGRFGAAAAVGVGVGVVLFGLIRLIRLRLCDPLAENVLSLITPYLAYLPADALGGSGITASVVAGILLGRASPRTLTGQSRLQTRDVWQLITYLLEGLTFLLLGSQLPALIQVALSARVGLIAVAIVGTLIAVRSVVASTAVYLPTRLGWPRNGPSFAETLALSFAGTRGVITVAAALTISLGVSSSTGQRQRSVLILLAVLVTAVTLLGQGLSFRYVLAGLRLPNDRGRRAAERADAWERSLRAGTAAARDAVDTYQRAPDAALGASERGLPPSPAEREAFARQFFEQVVKENDRLANLEWDRAGRADGSPAAQEHVRREVMMRALSAQLGSLTSDRDADRLSQDDYDQLLRRVDLAGRPLGPDHAPRLPRTSKRSSGNRLTRWLTEHTTQ